MFHLVSSLEMHLKCWFWNKGKLQLIRYGCKGLSRNVLMCVNCASMFLFFSQLSEMKERARNYDNFL